MILWDVPLARVAQYTHCALRADGLWTIPAGSVAAAFAADLGSFFDSTATDEIDEDF